jgi:CubicO group peptidase (beta-lactamase class C family)
MVSMLAIPILALVSAQAGSPDLEAKKKEIDRLVAPLLEAGLIPGFVIGVVDRNGSDVFGYGRERDAQETTPGGETIFEIGSVTKVFTALLLAEMADRDEVKLDDPAETFLPAGTKMPEHGGKKIRLSHLATHTSGLPTLPPSFRPKDPANPYADLGAPELHAFLSSYALERDPGQEYAYSNLGMGLLGDLLALRSRKAFGALLNERLLEPLGMRSTGIALDASMKYRMAEGHDETGRAAAPWDFAALAGAGGLRSCADDLIAFLRANMGLARTPLTAAIAVSHAARKSIEGGKIALGWHILDDGATYWHNGQTGGHHSFIAFRKKRALGVVVLANAAVEEVDAIGFTVMKILAGEPYRAIDVEPRSKQGGRARKEESRSSEAAAPVEKPRDLRSLRPRLDAWVGPYLSDDWTPSMIVALVDGKKAEYFSWGAESQERPRPPDPSTLFELGSVSKVFTGALLAEMALKGEVRLEDPVERYLPTGVKVPSKNGKKITLLDLATHRSGLPRVPSNLRPRDPYDEYAGYTSDQLFEFLSAESLGDVPGERYELSNTGYALLGAALAHRAGRSFGSLLFDRISAPLSLSNTAIGIQLHEQHLAQGHDAPGIPRAPWTFTNSAFDAALGLHSSAQELVRFLRASFPKTKSPLDEALQRAQAIQRPRDIGGAAALGWEVLADGRTFYQSGKTGGHRSFIAFDRDKRIGVVILANAAGAPIERLGLAALGLLSGKPTEPPPLRRTIVLDMATLKRIVGKYEIARDPTPEKVQVRSDGRRLFLSREGMGEIPIYPESSRHFYGRGTDVEIDATTRGLVIHLDDKHETAERK